MYIFFKHLDNVWTMIKQTADIVLRAQTSETYSLPVFQLPKNIMNRLSFTRRVSQDVLNENQDELKDDSTPILVLDTDNIWNKPPNEDIPTR